jgi:hypothetical protein
MKGFFRLQEEKLAVRLITWQCQKKNIPLPPAAELEKKAAQLVDDAHRIAKERGSNVLTILKDMLADVKKNNDGQKD